jgi:hypothetical protein
MSLESGALPSRKHLLLQTGVNKKSTLLTRPLVDTDGTSGKLLRMSSQLSACSTQHGGDAMDDGYGYLTLTAPEAAPCA